MVHGRRVWRVIISRSIVDWLATNHARRSIGARFAKDCVAQLLPLVTVAVVGGHRCPPHLASCLPLLHLLVWDVFVHEHVVSAIDAGFV